MRGLASPHPILGAMCGLSAVAVHQHRRRHPFRAANADPHGPDYSADHRVSSVAVRSQVVDALVMQFVRFHRLYISVYSAMLGSTVDTSFCVSLWRFSRFST